MNLEVDFGMDARYMLRTIINRGRNQIESSFQRYASMRSVGGVGELLVLDMTGFRLSCASLNLMWKT